MFWLILLLAGLLEVAWSVGLKLLDGAPRPWLIAATITAIVLSMALLTLAMKHISLGTAYAVWTGIGIVGAFIAGVMLFNESITWSKLLSVGLILCGVIGLKLSGR